MCLAQLDSRQVVPCGADYLIDEQEIASAASGVSVNVPNEVNLAPSGDYYVSTFLSVEKTGDWDNDPETPDTAALIQIDSAAFDDVANYVNVNQPDAPASVNLTAVGNEVM